MAFVRKYWWVVLVILVITGLFFYRSKNAKAKELKDKSYTVTKQDLTDSLEISGEVDAMEKATLKFQTSGMLAWVGVKEGDTVKKFQILANLDQRELQNQFSQLMNTYSKSRNDFEQAQSDNKNWETNGMSDTAREAIKRTLQDEQADLNNSVLAVEAKNLALKFSVLYTPIAGTVTKVEAPVAGQNITPTTATFEVVNPNSLYFSALADQTEVTKFAKGQTGELMLDAFPDEKLTVIVENISFVPKSGESGTVYEIKMKMSSPSASVRMGMTGDTKFIFEKNDGVIAIPSAYIKTVDGKSFVTKMDKDKKLQSEITIGKNIDGMVEVTSGLNENEVIYSN